MTRKEAKQFKKISHLVKKIYDLQEANPEEDIKSMVYGVKPDWDKTGEGHFHESCDIIEFAFQQGGICFYSGLWKNAEGEQIAAIMGVLPDRNDVPVKWGYIKHQKKWGYYTMMGWANRKITDYSDPVVEKYLCNVRDHALHYIIDNFDYDKVANNFVSAQRLISRKEFGLSLSGDSYWAKNKYNCKVETVMVSHDA